MTTAARPLKDFRLRANRAMWDEMAAIHAKGSASYPVARLKAGRKPAEWRRPMLDDLGSVRGKKVLHLQCHIGMRTLWWASRGAKVTGVDYSPRGIREARALSEASGIPARFIEANVYDLPRLLHERFDLVTTDGGVLNWLPDLPRWARVIRRFLKPRGVFHLQEIHPMVGALNLHPRTGAPHLTGSYFSRGAIPDNSGGGTYANPKARLTRRTNWEWQHSIADVVTALRSAGLTIDWLREYSKLPFDLGYDLGRQFGRWDRDGWWHLKGWEGKLPMTFTIRAHPESRRTRGARGRGRGR